jgi:alpha-tubulin suppressor-like RCC1 family protein
VSFLHHPSPMHLLSSPRFLSPWALGVLLGLQACTPNQRALIAATDGTDDEDAAGGDADSDKEGSASKSVRMPWEDAGNGGSYSDPCPSGNCAGTPSGSEGSESGASPCGVQPSVELPACTTLVCNEGSKTWVSQGMTGMPCDDGNWCTTGDICTGTVCSGSFPAGETSCAGWSTVSVGATHACATKTDGTLWCWGDNSAGQLGQGSHNSQSASIPLTVGHGDDWTLTDHAGVGFTCGLRAGGTLWCWGINSTGQLAAAFSGTGAVSKEAMPRQVGTASDWTGVHHGATFACGLRADDSLWCWGNNTYGQLGRNETGSGMYGEAEPVSVSPGGWQDISLGLSHGCGVRGDGTLWCWGDNSVGQLGVGFGNAPINENGHEIYPSPVAVDENNDWSNIECGAAHCCATKVEGSLWCWGNSLSGAVGIGLEGAFVPTPTQVGQSTGWSKMSLGADHSCAVRSDKTLWCWGNGQLGRLGHGIDTEDNATVPELVDGTANWVNVSAGGNTSCALKEDDSLWCWGSNTHGMSGSPESDFVVSSPSMVR